MTNNLLKANTPLNILFEQKAHWEPKLFGSPNYLESHMLAAVVVNPDRLLAQGNRACVCGDLSRQRLAAQGMCVWGFIKTGWQHRTCVCGDLSRQVGSTGHVVVVINPDRFW